MPAHRNHFGTRALWAGEEHPSPNEDVALPIHHSVTFAYDDIDE